MQYQKVHESALADDPNVYDYDSFHDGYQEARAAAEVRKHDDESSGPKYIFALLAAQKQREREQGITYERTLARGRAAEDALHGDKEVFVTSAYKAKLQEDEQWQAKQDAKCAPLASLWVHRLRSAKPLHAGCGVRGGYSCARSAVQIVCPAEWMPRLTEHRAVATLRCRKPYTWWYQRSERPPRRRTRGASVRRGAPHA